MKYITDRAALLKAIRKPGKVYVVMKTHGDTALVMAEKRDILRVVGDDSFKDCSVRGYYKDSSLIIEPNTDRFRKLSNTEQALLNKLQEILSCVFHEGSYSNIEDLLGFFSSMESIDNAQLLKNLMKGLSKEEKEQKIKDRSESLGRF